MTETTDQKRATGFPKGNTVGSAHRFKKGVLSPPSENGIVGAAIAHGSNGKGKDGLPGFFQFLLKKDLKSFARLVGRLLPVRLDEDVAAAIGRVTVNVVAVQEGRYLSEQETASGRLNPVAPAASHRGAGRRTSRGRDRAARRLRAAGQCAQA